MKRRSFSCFVAALICSLTGLAGFADTIVVPNGNTTVEGNTGLTVPFAIGEMRWQQVYDRSQFSGLFSDQILITHLAFRIEGPVGTSFSTVVNDLTIRMSSTPVDFSSASTEFNKNFGADLEIVLPTQNFQLSGVKSSTTSFDVVIPLPNAFQYDRRDGSLLVDFMVPNRQDVPLLDGYSNSPDIPAFGIFGAVNNISGVKTAQSLVTEFQFLSVPEPGVCGLLGVALLGVPFLSRKIK